MSSAAKGFADGFRASDEQWREELRERIQQIKDIDKNWGINLHCSRAWNALFKLAYPTPLCQSCGEREATHCWVKDDENQIALWLCRKTGNDSTPTHCLDCALSEVRKAVES
jgi:hypothetical protein